MPILSDAQRATLAARLAEPDCAGLSDAGAAGMLSTPSLVDNPAPATRLKPFDAAALQALLSPESLGRFLILPLAGKIVDVLNLSDPALAIQYASALAAADPPVITAAEREAIVARVQQTEPVPDWPAMVPGPSWARATWPEVEFDQGDDTAVANQVTAAMVAEARAASQ